MDGRLTGHGAIGGSVLCHGSLAPNGILTLGSGLTTSTGSLLEFRLGTTSDRIELAGPLNLAGRIEISAPPGIASGTYPLITYTGTPVFGTIELSTSPGNYTCQLDLATPGRINAIITSTLSWPSVPGKTYEILGNTTLTGPWTPVHPMTAGPGAISSFAIPPPYVSSAFFRIHIVE